MAGDSAKLPTDRADVERVAEAMWQAESRRAASRDRLIPWAEENEEVRAAWRDNAKAAIAALPPKLPEPVDGVTQACNAMLVRDNKRMRDAGTKLAEAALHVVREYDGLHRLALAVADWSKALADEGDRPHAALKARVLAQGEDT